MNEGKNEYSGEFPNEEKRVGLVNLQRAKEWSGASYYYFFKNGLYTKADIGRYLNAQPLDMVQGIGLSFDIEDGSLTKDQLIYLILESITTK